MKWLSENNLIHSLIKDEVKNVVQQNFIFSEDIITKLRADNEVWGNFQNFTEPYKRIRIAYIESARKRPDEFEKRLNNFVSKTKDNKLIKGFGGIEKYY
ncbi:YdeI/OmpD-associated family protein [Flagellimonas onchidii]|uniref:YdeI/OmpD-associated family protein n=1 Tax=Flagellimonas onchidii TaxID=2562684 RepID=UPI00197A7AFE|nr:YdeI/OmpD-associated family protein [Allomuricauda onchidii]